MDLFKTFAPAALIAILGFAIAYRFVDPAPPQRLVIATGAADGAYHLFARQYRDYLHTQGIALEILPTRGSVDNIALLRDGQADVALIQGGTTDPEQQPELLSLGSLYFEPLWIFHRRDLQLQRLTDLAGQRIAIGPEGSGSRAVGELLLEDNGISATNANLPPLGGSAAQQALLAGDIDAALFIGSPRSPVIQALITAPGLRLLDFDRGAGYVRLHRFLSRVTLPEGVLDMGRNLPATDTRLLAPTANLVVGKELHPALIDLLLQAARETHGGGGLFEDIGQFPTPEYLVYPLHKEASRFYESGPPLLQRFLPFWAATLVDRLKVMLLPLVALLFPLIKVMPPIYRWRMRARIYRWYRQLEMVDLALAGPPEDTNRDTLSAELDRIEQEVIRVTVPLSYAVELYDLRMHLGLVRKRLLD